jgi:hypothetical protein
MVLIYLLIFLFCLLIGYQIYLSYSNNRLMEGLENADTSTSSSDNGSSSTSGSTNDTNNGSAEYKPYNLNDPNNALILSQQNAGNIEVLRGQVDDLKKIKSTVDTLQQNVDQMQTQIDGLVQQQADYAQEIAGSTPPTITGTEQQTVADVS